jgi:hypothetical protein
MANIFSLFGTIFIDNEKANKAIDKTTGKGKDGSKSLGQSFRKIASGAAKVGGAVVAGAAVLTTATAAMVKKTADAAGAIQDASMRVGISAEDYQKWTYAAGQAGMEASKLESVMKKQQKSFSDAASGSKTAADAYKNLGVNINDFENSGQAFDVVIDKLAGMEDITKRNEIANDLFGKSYADIAPLLAEGATGISKLKQEAVDMGAVMSNDAVASGEKLGDTIDKLKAAGTGIFNRLGSSLIPLIQKGADMLIKFMPQIQGIISTLSPVIGNIFEQLLPPLMQLITSVLPMAANLITILMPPISQIITALLPIIIQLLNMLLPPIMQIIQLVLPLIASLLPPLLQLLAPILTLLQPIFDMLIMILTPLTELLNMILPPLIKIVTKFIEFAIVPLKAQLTFLSGIVSSYFKAAFDQIKNIFNTAKGVFNGLIDFVKNVFTGNWKGAWKAVVGIFSTIWTGIKNTFKIPMNFIIDGINAFIRGLNKLTIPDWVPGVGGKGFNIAEIKRLRVGLEYVPYNDFPALLHRGEQVLTASQKKEYDAMKVSGHNQTVNINIAPGAVSIGKVDKETNIDALTNEIVDKIVTKIKKKGLAFA